MDGIPISDMVAPQKKMLVSSKEEKEEKEEYSQEMQNVYAKKKEDS